MQNERLEILTSLTRHMSLADDVKLAELANSCQYFTGADFKALLYNAQLSAIHEQYGVDFCGVRDESSNNSDARLSVGANEVGVDHGSDVSGGRRSDSENSATSTGSWEAINSTKGAVNTLFIVALVNFAGRLSSVLVHTYVFERYAFTVSAAELHREFTLLGSPQAALNAQTSVTYISRLEEGVAEMSDELEQTIRRQVSGFCRSTITTEHKALLCNTI